jgi:hypothetical protein
MQRRQAGEQVAQLPSLKRRASAGAAYHMVHSRHSSNSGFQSARPSDAITEVDEVDDSYFDTRRPTSTRRYVDTRGNQVFQQENKRIVIHEEPPPKRRVHWLLILGIGMALMLGLYLGVNWLANWWTNHQLDATYGMPRTYQVDAVVSHGDSAANPSHFIFLNLGGHVEIIELPGGNAAKAIVYVGPTLFSDNAPLIPVTGEFKTVNGTEEMLVHVQNQTIVYVSDGTKFVPR